jgi:serine/threonine protein kinase
MMGTAAFMPPEQARDTRKADARSDLYSLGCTLFYLLTGRTAFSGMTQIDIILSHVNQPIPSLRKFNPQIPDGSGSDLSTSWSPRIRTTDINQPTNCFLVLQGALEECRSPSNHQTQRGTPAGKEVDSIRSLVAGVNEQFCHGCQSIGFQIRDDRRCGPGRPRHPQDG